MADSTEAIIVRRMAEMQGMLDAGEYDCLPVNVATDDIAELIAELRSTQAALTRAREALKQISALNNAPPEFVDINTAAEIARIALDAARTPGAHE